MTTGRGWRGEVKHSGSSECNGQTVRYEWRVRVVRRVGVLLGLLTELVQRGDRIREAVLRISLGTEGESNYTYTHVYTSISKAHTSDGSSHAGEGVSRSWRLGITNLQHFTLVIGVIRLLGDLGQPMDGLI